MFSELVWGWGSRRTDETLHLVEHGRLFRRRHPSWPEQRRRLGEVGTNLTLSTAIESKTAPTARTRGSHCPDSRESQGSKSPESWVK
jgi:hypothetical protein